MARAARTSSSATLKKLKQTAGDSYRAQIVFGFRWFELHPSERRAAAVILDLIPRNEEEDSVWHTFGGFLCSTESLSEVTALAELGDRLPHDLSTAIMLSPDKMFEYVSYAYVSIQDPHSDYAVRMRPVCRYRHQQFLKAVDKLSTGDKEWFTSKIFNPNGCHVLAQPEAE